MIDESNAHNYGDFVIYGDETGDHSMDTTYKHHPIFALVLCIFSKDAYTIEPEKRKASEYKKYSEA